MMSCSSYEESSPNSLPDTLSPCFQIRRSCAALMDNEPWTSSSGKRTVTIDTARLNSVAQSIVAPLFSSSASSSDLVSSSSSSSTTTIQWDEYSWHYTASSPECLTYLTEEQRDERVALYIIALDALNFCFWPIPGLNYEHLAMALKSIAQKDEQLLPKLSSNCSKDWNDQHYALSPYKLSCITIEGMRRLLEESHLLPLQQGEPLPNLDERCRLWNELGQGLLQRFHGRALQLIQSCQRSADYLVYLLLQTFPGFHDTAIDDTGRQVFFYKRAQILVGDLWASLRSRCTYCDFYDIHKLTMFPDYRVPQLLRHMQILIYSPKLAQQIDSQKVLMAGSMDELYIRAATVVAVEQMVQVIKDTLSYKTSNSNESPPLLCDSKDEALSPNYWCAMKLDWHLWQMGEALEKQGALSHHHRVMTIFY
jgi:hypothetical protein